MRNVTLALAVAGALAIAASAVHTEEATEVMLKPGDPAPAFSLPGTDGKTYSLASLKGKPVVIAWFPKAFTSGCTMECKSMRQAGDKIRQYDVAYFAASVDDPETNKKFAESLDLDFPILSDPGKEVAKAYGVVTPERQYAHRWTFYIGPDGKILAVDREVKPATAAEDIAAKLQQLGVKKKTS
ncbi:MAG TPA: peroxiredoxin [Vicinamibacterales bacterium]|nr:peroxiredoxin [Vicinamibacterales bacterium]